MKKLILCFCLSVVFIFSNLLPAVACWTPVTSFEIFSEHGNRVFVFIPGEYGIGNAYAAVYELVNSERHLIYTVEDLPSFSYKSNFYFSDDMMHFARTSPVLGGGFEVFSHGIPTMLVERSDFIRNYAAIEAELSVGPQHRIRWSIDRDLTQGSTIAINTDEGNTFYFDLEAGKFEPSVALFLAQNSRNVIYIVVGAAAILIAAGLVIFKKKVLW